MYTGYLSYTGSQVMVIFSTRIPNNIYLSRMICTDIKDKYTGIQTWVANPVRMIASIKMLGWTASVINTLLKILI